MRLSDKLNIVLHRLFTAYVMRAYAKKSKRVEAKHPELFKAVDPELSAKHKVLWSRTGLKSGDRWLRLHVNLTGIEDYTFCPEDIFFSRIERVMNDCNQAGYGPEEKNELWRYVPKGAEPEVVVRFVRGSFFDASGIWISDKDAQRLIDEAQEVVGKPCRASGGNGVELFKPGELRAEWIRRRFDSYVVQKKIEQGVFSAQFNASSVNTVRMMTMRCPWDGKMVVCRSMMRMGVSDAVIDNMMKGGLCVCIGDNGQLGRYAYDYDGKRFEKHPVSGLAFEGLVHPDYEAMKALALAIHSHIAGYNLLSFDLVPRKDGSICVVEINATSEGITQLQYDFGGLFGGYTERLVDYVACNLKYDAFNHLRTWY